MASCPEGWSWIEEAPPAGIEPVSVVVGDDGVVWMVDVNWTLRFRPGLTSAHPQVVCLLLSHPVHRLRVCFHDVALL